MEFKTQIENRVANSSDRWYGKTSNGIKGLVRSSVALTFILVFLSSTSLFAQESDDCDLAAGSEHSINLGSCDYNTMNSDNATDYWNSASGCSSSDVDDAWIWFTGDGTTLTITYDPISGGKDPIIHLFSGACSTGMTALACANDGGANANETITYATTDGTTYHVRVEDDNSSSSMNGQICIWRACAAIAAGTYSIGPTGDDYKTIADAMCELEASGTITGAYIFELADDYVSSVETFPLTFNAIAGASATNTITIRPASGATGRVIENGFTTASQAMIRVKGADYYIFDGRPGGTGSFDSDCMTFQNTQGGAATTRPVIEFIEDASYNTLQYIYVRGEFQNPFNTEGLIVAGTATATGNDADTVRYCYIGDLAAADGTGYRPQAGLMCNGTTANPNDDWVVDNCEFVNNNYSNGAANCIDLWVIDGGDGWDITNNHIYQTDTYTAHSQLGANLAFSVGGDFTITGNYFGGTAKSCGGTAMTWTGATAEWRCICFLPGCTGTGSTISGNTFTNWDMTGSGSPQLRVMYLDPGGYDLTVGSSGNGNTIGSQSATDAIVITNSTTGNAFHGIYAGSSSGTTTIAYNTIGGITQDGTGDDAEFYGIYVIDATSVVDNNTIGGTVANSIQVASSSDSPLFAIYNTTTDAFTCTNNTIQNIDLNGATEEFRGIYNTAGPMDDCSDNVIKSVNQTGTDDCYPIWHAGTTATMATDSVHTITTGGALYGMVSTGSGAVTMNANILGSTADNNMTTTGDDICYGIFNSGTSTVAITDNRVQQYYVNNSGGTAVRFNGIYTTAGTNTITGNHVKDIEVNGSTGGVIFVGIEINGATNTSQTVSSNYVGTIAATNTGAVGNDMYGMWLLTGGGTAAKNQIKAMEIKSTSSSADMRGYVHDATFDAHNNVIILSNESNTTPVQITGIYDYGDGCDYYHNTVLLSGDQGGNTGDTYAFRLISTATGTLNLDNNVFVNLRTNDGDTYGIYFDDLTPAPVCDYNYIEASNFIGYDGTNRTAIGDWTGAAGGANSESATETFNTSGAPTNAAFTGADMANDLAVNEDIAATARDATPWAGAFEGPNVVLVLPIELIKFNAYVSGTDVKTEWATAMEVDNDFFTVERSSDGETFEEVGEVVGAGNSNEVLEYDLTDFDPLMGRSYYRLKQTDFDGKWSYSNVITVNRSAEDHNQLQVYPNPATKNDILRLEIDGFEHDKPVLVIMRNAMGQEVYSKLVVTDYNGHAYTALDPEKRLPAGVYSITGSSNHEMFSKKVIIR